MSKNEYTIHAKPFILRWVIGSLVVWPISILLALLSLVMLIPLAYVSGSSSGLPEWLSSLISIFFIVLGIGVSSGYAVGVLQQRLLRRHLYWAADGWIKRSIVGGILGAFSVLGYSVLLSDNPLYIMPIFVTCLSMVQMFRLRHAVYDSWLWVLANLIAGIVFSGVVIRNHPELAYHDSLPMGLYLFAAAAQGFITGAVMLFLFEQKLQPMEIPVHEIEKRPYSVWDDAI